MKQQSAVAVAVAVADDVIAQRANVPNPSRGSPPTGQNLVRSVEKPRQAKPFPLRKPVFQRKNGLRVHRGRRATGVRSSLMFRIKDRRLHPPLNRQK